MVAEVKFAKMRSASADKFPHILVCIIGFTSLQGVLPHAGLKQVKL